MLTLNNLTVHLGKNRYCFNLQTGTEQVCAILGKSGSGKSTLLNLIAGFLVAESGKLQWQKENLVGLPANQRPITTLFQQNNLFTHLNVAKNIGLGINPDLKLTNQDKDNIDQVLDEVGLAGYATHSATKLSGGEQQRVALARCLLRKQPILLLDEPFSALDEHTRHDMLELTRNVIHKHKLCVVLVTHNKDDARLLDAQQYQLTDGQLHLQS